MVFGQSYKKNHHNFETRHDDDIILEPKNIYNKRNITRSKSSIVTSRRELITSYSIFQLLPGLEPS